MTAPVNSTISQQAPPLTSSREASQQTVAPAAQTGPATQELPGTQATPAVSVSKRATAGQAMAKGASTAYPGYSDATVQEVAQQIAAGIYKPPPEAVAKALVRYEARILKGD